MKNILIIDLDDEREIPIMIGKGAEIEPPSNRDEAKTMIDGDIKTLVAALVSLIHVADENNYTPSKESLDFVANELNGAFFKPSNEDSEDTLG